MFFQTYSRPYRRDTEPFPCAWHMLMDTGGDDMDTQGTVVVRLSTSSARIPLQGATVTITKRFPDGEVQLLAVRVTNFDG